MLQDSVQEGDGGVTEFQYVGQGEVAAEKVIRGALMFMGADFVRPDPWCPQDYAVIYTGGGPGPSWATEGCICSPITLARVTRKLGMTMLPWSR